VRSRLKNAKADESGGESIEGAFYFPRARFRNRGLHFRRNGHRTRVTAEFPAVGTGRGGGGAGAGETRGDARARARVGRVEENEEVTYERKIDDYN